MKPRKIQITFTDPDSPLDCVADFVQKEIDDEYCEHDLRENEMEMIIENRTEEVWERLRKWISYNECVTIEFDLDDPKVPPKVIKS